MIVKVNGIELNNNDPLYKNKKNAILICRDLGYKSVMPDYGTKIKKAVTETEITRIMYTCRHKMF